MLFVEIIKTEFVLLYREARLHLKLASRTQVVFLLRYRKFYELLVTWSENRRNLSPVHHASLLINIQWWSKGSLKFIFSRMRINNLNTTIITGLSWEIPPPYKTQIGAQLSSCQNIVSFISLFTFSTFFWSPVYFKIRLLQYHLSNSTITCYTPKCIYKN